MVPRSIIEPLVENLVMGTEQVLDRTVGRWVAEAADEVLQPINIATPDNAGEGIGTPHIPTGTKPNGVEDVIWVAVLGIDEFVGEVSDQPVGRGSIKKDRFSFARQMMPSLSW